MRFTQTRSTPALQWTLSLLALGTLGCNDGRDEVIDDGTTMVDPTTLTTTVADTSSTGIVETTETSIDPDTSSTGEPPIPACETIQCGEECCDDDEECVLGACLPACDSAVRC